VTNERTLAQYRVPYATWIGAAICLAAIAPLLYLGRHLNFLSDEWTFIVHRNDSGIAALLRPHNEHWSTLLTVILRALFATIGLRVYWPYLLLLELFHVATAFVLFLLVRRRAGEVLGLAAMLAILFIGRGAENIFWAFQIGFVGSVLFGLVAMLALDPPNPGRGRLVVASVAMLLALMFSGIGIFFCAAIAVQLLVDRRRHAQPGVAILPVLAYLVWFFAYGRAGAVSHRFPLSPTALISLPGFVPFGIGSALAGLFGLSDRWASALLAAATALLALAWYRRGWVGAVALSLAAGLIAQYGLTALVRGQFGDLQAGSSRYVYVGAIFLVLLIADALAQFRVRRGLVLVSAIVFVVVLDYSAYHLADFARGRDFRVAEQQGQLQALELLRGSPSMQLDAEVDATNYTPITARQYYEAIDALGSPVPRISLAQLGASAAAPVDTMIRRIFAPTITSGSGAAGQTMGCQAYLGASTANVDLKAAAGSAVEVSAATAETIGVTVTLFASPMGNPDQQVEVSAGTTVRIELPRTAEPITWHLGIALPAAGQTQICGP